MYGSGRQRPDGGANGSGRWRRVRSVRQCGSAGAGASATGVLDDGEVLDDGKRTTSLVQGRSAGAAGQGVFDDR